MERSSLFYVYKTTNKVNGKIYVGVHKSNDIENDSYLGSGTILNKALKKYGTESFVREILYCYDDVDMAYGKEAEIVNEDFIALDTTYNVTLGGKGGFHHVDNTGDKNPMRNKDTAKKLGDAIKKTRNGDKKEYYDNISINNLKKATEAIVGVKHTPERIEKAVKSRAESYAKNGTPKGWKLSKESRQNLSNGWTEEKRKARSELMKKRVADGYDMGLTRGKKLSEETKAKMSKSWTPERRKKHSDSVKLYWINKRKEEENQNV